MHSQKKKEKGKGFYIFFPLIIIISLLLTPILDENIYIVLQKRTNDIQAVPNFKNGAYKWCF